MVPYDAVPANQGGHVVGNKRRMSQGAAAEIQNMEHVESHAVGNLSRTKKIGKQMPIYSSCID